MNPQAISLCIALVSVPVVLVGWAIAAHNLRVWQVRRVARSLPVGTRERILAQIAESARGSSICTLLIPARFPTAESSGEPTSQSELTASRFGGPPYGEAGEQWPTREDGSLEPTDFLIQVRLDDPLPPPWPGRLIVVFWKFDEQQTVLVYAAPSSARYVRRPGSPDASPECVLMPLPIPNANPPSIQNSPAQAAASEAPSELFDSKNENEWQLPYDPSLLIESVSGLRDELRQFTPRPADLLTHLMLTERHGYELDVSDIVQMGGRPQWVQDDPGPRTCPECGKRLRFLFQFGDLSGQSRLGDAGVCFVFGCDAHPDSAQSLVQMC
ncbi:MAG: DUF1963 domain-containing protein [Planctomycetota bacterium]